MGYFANGSEGEYYQAEYCAKCMHDQNIVHGGPGCPVWLLHLLHNYGECNNPESFLHVLIPRDKGGGNGPCTMFVPRDNLYPVCELCAAGLPVELGMHKTKSGGHAGPCIAPSQDAVQTDGG